MHAHAPGYPTAVNINGESFRLKHNRKAGLLGVTSKAPKR